MVEPFPEVVGVLDELRARGVRLAVVSDAWPTLPELHAGVELGGYFEAYAISAVLGCTKPDPRMYTLEGDRRAVGVVLVVVPNVLDRGNDVVERPIE